eukprot:TRINITY_DN7947_c0_g1_i1.p1 TRINITY_DN7947_c0_g1~~TRINITY_DN7947_c0_g1_i1.p1  ORF type:complete len:893 (-),score=212.98 TRINITY_DN7947_c0_g1_i1:41-2719(-)
MWDSLRPILELDLADFDASSELDAVVENLHQVTLEFGAYDWATSEQPFKELCAVLVTLLDKCAGRSDDAVIDSLTCLKYVAAEPKLFKFVVDAGALKRLVAFLADEVSLAVRILAIECLFTLAEWGFPSLWVARAPGCVPRLLELAQSSEEDEAVAALRVLAILANAAVSNRQLITRAGAVPIVISLLSNMLRAIRWHAAAVVCFLSKYPQDRVAFAKDSDCLDALVGLMNDECARAVQAVRYIALDVTVGVQALLGHPTLLAALLNSLSSVSVLVAEEAAGALQNLAMASDEAASILVNANAPLILVQLLTASTAAGDHAACLAALAAFTKRHRYRYDVFMAGGTKRITAHLESSFTLCRLWATRAIADLCSVNEARRTVWESGAVPMLLETLLLADVHVVAAAIRALAWISLDEAARPLLLESHGIAAISPLLSTQRATQWADNETAVDVRRKNAILEAQSKRIIVPPIPMAPTAAKTNTASPGTRMSLARRSSRAPSLAAAAIARDLPPQRRQSRLFETPPLVSTPTIQPIPIAPDDMVVDPIMEETDTVAAVQVHAALCVTHLAWMGVETASGIGMNTLLHLQALLGSNVPAVRLQAVTAIAWQCDQADVNRKRLDANGCIPLMLAMAQGLSIVGATSESVQTILLDHIRAGAPFPDALTEDMKTALFVLGNLLRNDDIKDKLIAEPGFLDLLINCTGTGYFRAPQALALLCQDPDLRDRLVEMNAMVAVTKALKRAHTSGKYDHEYACSVAAEMCINPMAAKAVMVNKETECLQALLTAAVAEHTRSEALRALASIALHKDLVEKLLESNLEKIVVDVLQRKIARVDTYRSAALVAAHLFQFEYLRAELTAIADALRQIRSVTRDVASIRAADEALTIYNAPSQYKY